MIQNYRTKHNTSITIGRNVVQNFKTEEEFRAWFNMDYGYSEEENKEIKKIVAAHLYDDCIAHEKYRFIKYLQPYL